MAVDTFNDRCEAPSLTLACSGAVVMRVKGGDDFVQVKPEFLQLTSGFESVDYARLVVSVARRQSTGFGNDAASFVVTDGVYCQARCRCNRSNFHAYPLTLELTPEFIVEQ